MAEPESMIIPMLRDIRADMNRRFDEIGRQLGKVDARFDRLEQRFESISEGLKRREPNLIDHLTSGPRFDDFDFERDYDTGREIDLE
jgi:hypothetical protein